MSLRSDRGSRAWGFRKTRLAFFRAVFFLPSVCSIVAISILWQWLYEKDQGLINTGLLK